MALAGVGSWRAGRFGVRLACSGHNNRLNGDQKRGGFLSLLSGLSELIFGVVSPVGPSFWRVSRIYLLQCKQKINKFSLFTMLLHRTVL
jgi:hypothetical protein